MASPTQIATSSSEGPSSPAVVAQAHAARLQRHQKPSFLSLPSRPNFMMDEDASPSRSTYLPLLSPSVEEEELEDRLPAAGSQPFKRRRVSTPNPIPHGGGRSYFQINKGETAKNTVEGKSENATAGHKRDHEQTASSSSIPQVSPYQRRLTLVTLPDDIAKPLLLALDRSSKQDSSDENTNTLINRQYRAMSVPRNMRSTIHGNLLATPRSAFANSSSSADARRGSIRAQQLALLASQARMASSGTTNVNAALRAERAVKGAVLQAVEEVQTAKKARIAAVPWSGSTQLEEEGEEVQRSNSSGEDEVNRRSGLTGTAWSEALSDPTAAASFLDTAKEVARDWANGFYAYEKQWVGGALQREKERLNSVASIAAPTSSTASASTATESEHAAAVVATGSDAASSMPPTEARARVSLSPDVKASLLTAQKRLSVAIPSTSATSGSSSSLVTSSSPSSSSPTFATAPTANGSSGGKLVDVLSNFASLIDSRKEGCHSLEKLAQNARRLSSIPLTSIRDATATNASAGQTPLNYHNHHHAHDIPSTNNCSTTTTSSAVSSPSSIVEVVSQ